MPVKDYRKLKTPFFEIRISDSSGKRMVPLPHHILRLVEKVEILETFRPGEFSKITLTIVEGSREPGSPDVSEGTKGLYQLDSSEGAKDMDLAGSLTNRSGIISDLRFSGTGGLTFATEKEISEGRIRDTTLINIQGKSVTRRHKNEPRRPIFLFQERNQVKLTWGYKEDKASVRSIRGYIILVETMYPEKGQPRTTITCQDTGAFLDQVAAPKGVPFGKAVKLGKGTVVEFDDLKTDDLIRKICNDLGLPCIVSKNLPNEKMDKGKQKVWLGGESFQQFMERLAKAHNAYYKVFPDKDTGLDTLVFIKDQDFESKPVVNDPELFHYKAPGSIIKTISIKADFGTIGTVSKCTVAETDAEVVDQSTQTGEELVKIFDAISSKSIVSKKEEHVDLDPTINNPILACKELTNNILPGFMTGVMEVTPASGDESTLSEAAKVDSTIANKKTILMDISTLGFTKLTPGLIEIRGIGQRYSGKYRLLTVTHTIDSGGYICRAMGETYALAKGGIGIPDAVEGNIPTTVEVGVFDPRRETTTTTTPGDVVVRNELNRKQGVE